MLCKGKGRATSKGTLTRTDEEIFNISRVLLGRAGGKEGAPRANRGGGGKPPVASHQSVLGREGPLKGDH